MFWRILESAIASAMSRAMIDARLDTLFERVRRMGVLSDAEIARLRTEVHERLEDVEREGRELRGAVDRLVQGIAERFLRPQGSDAPGRQAPRPGRNGSNRAPGRQGPAAPGRTPPDPDGGDAR